MRDDVAKLRKALTDIAEGNIPPGMIEAAEAESGSLLEFKLAFKERFCTWMQKTAKEALT